MARPRNDDHDLELMAAWLYYVHGLGQEQVARSLDVSRTKVARLLSRARETGLVKITLDHELAETLALSEWIAKRYGVERFIVTPPTNVAVTDRDLAEQIGRQSVGIVASNLLIRRVNNSGGRINIGVGGGRTLRHVVDCLPAPARAGREGHRACRNHEHRRRLGHLQHCAGARGGIGGRGLYLARPDFPQPQGNPRYAGSGPGARRGFGARGGHGSQHPWLRSGFGGKLFRTSDANSRSGISMRPGRPAPSARLPGFCSTRRAGLPRRRSTRGAWASRWMTCGKRTRS